MKTFPEKKALYLSVNVFWDPEYWTRVLPLSIEALYRLYLD